MAYCSLFQSDLVGNYQSGELPPPDYNGRPESVDANFEMPVIMPYDEWRGGTAVTAAQQGKLTDSNLLQAFYWLHFSPFYCRVYSQSPCRAALPLRFTFSLPSRTISVCGCRHVFPLAITIYLDLTAPYIFPTFY